MGIKFVEKSYLDIEGIAVLTVSSGSTTKERMRDRRYSTKWASSGSDDTTTETIEVDFGADRDIDYIQLLNFNWKEFTIKYDVLGVPTNFSTAISETVNTATTSKIYNNFNLVTTSKIYITIEKTITANAEKFIGELILSNVLGTLNGFPMIKPIVSKNKIEKKMLRGKRKVVDRDETIGYTLVFKVYPDEDDMVLMEELWDRRSPFHILISGGDETVFTHIRRGYRNQDIRLVSCNKEYSPTYYKNLYFSGLDFQFDLIEV